MPSSSKQPSLTPPPTSTTFHGPRHMDHAISFIALTHIILMNCISWNRHKTPQMAPTAPSTGLDTQGHTVNPCCPESK